MATTNGYIPASEVITDAAQSVGDPGAGIVGRPRYLSFVQQALTQMCYDTHFEKRYFDTEIPANRIVTMPRWMAGIDGVQAYNGDKCNPLNAVNIYEKEDYIHGGGPAGLTSTPWNNETDAMQFSMGGMVEPWNLRYYGINKGKMYLSQQCTGYQWLRIKFSGLGFDCFDGDETLEVPMWSRQAVTDWVAWKAASIRQFEEGKTNMMRSVLGDKKFEVNDPRGSWSRARIHWGSMDAKDRRDVALYISRMGHGGETF